MAYENLCMYCFEDNGGNDVCPHCGRDARAAVPQIQLLPGTLVYHDRFLIGRALGQDASGIVYAALDTKRGTKIRIREYLPRDSARRLNSGEVVPEPGAEDAFEAGLQKLRASVEEVEDPAKRHFFFEENGTGYIAQRKNAAAASGEDLGTTSDIVTDALTAFGLSAKDSGHFADILAAASTNANTNVSMLGESFKYAAPVAGSLGISAEDTSIALGLMANSGIKASQAGTALRTGLTNLAKPTKQMQTYMDKYNIALVENDDGSINLRETMISLREKMGNLSESEQAAAASAIFGKNSMAGWLSIINASDEDFDKLTGAIDNCDGTAESMAEMMQDNLSGQLTILKSQLEELAISFDDLLMPIIRKVVSAIQGFIDKLNGMNDSQRQTIIKIAALVAAIGPLLLIVGKLISTVGSAMSGFASLGKGIISLSTKMSSLGGVSGVLSKAIGFLTSPIGLVIAAVAVLVAAFVHLWQTNEEFREKVTAIWNRIKEIFSGFVDGIKERLGNLGISFSDITEAIGKVWDGFCNLLAPVFIAAFEIIADVLETVLGVLTGLFDVKTLSSGW